MRGGGKLRDERHPASGAARHLLPQGEKELEPALRLLILGGTTQASQLARVLASRGDIAPLLSFAGRTDKPVPPLIPHRIGGFGGIDGLAAFLQGERIDAVVDATHPFAARISAHAVAACRQTGVPLSVYTRAAWAPAAGDDWHVVPTIDAAVRTLHGLARDIECLRSSVILGRVRNTWVEGRTTPPPCPEGEVSSIAASSTRPLCGRLRMTSREADPLRVFLTTGRLDLARFRAVPQHHYLIRSIDPPDPSELPPDAIVILARPPFAVDAEIALMRTHRVELLVTKNSGGEASAAKLAAARALGIPVLMVDRPRPSGGLELYELETVLAWIAAQRARP